MGFTSRFSADGEAHFLTANYNPPQDTPPCPINPHKLLNFLDFPTSKS